MRPDELVPAIRKILDDPTLAWSRPDLREQALDALDALAALRNPVPEPAGSPGSPTLREALERARDSFDLIRRTIRNSRAAPNVFESLADFAKWGEEDAAAALAAAAGGGREDTDAS